MTNEEFLKHLSKLAPICPCLSCTGESRCEDVSGASRCVSPVLNRGEELTSSTCWQHSFFLMLSRRLLALFFCFTKVHSWLMVKLVSIQTLKTLFYCKAAFHWVNFQYALMHGSCSSSGIHTFLNSMRLLLAQFSCLSLPH